MAKKKTIPAVPTLTVNITLDDAHIVLTVLQARIIARSAKLDTASPALEEKINRELEALENFSDLLRYQVNINS